MRPLSTLHVVPDLPEPLAPLWEVAHNLWWTWNHEAIRAFHHIDPEAWRASGRNPLRFLSELGTAQLQGLTSNGELGERIRRVLAAYQRDLTRPTWFAESFPHSDLRVGYFSLEFGLTESLPIYSGGLGVLAGDHLKAASDLGVPMVGVGLLYRLGYFHQVLNQDGWQLETYPESDRDQMPVRLSRDAEGDPVVIEVSGAHGPVYAQVWEVDVGRTRLFLLDTHVEGNRPEDRALTDSLYGGDRAMRIRQEVLLGIGGMRALDAVGQRPTVCHMNEGHSSFLALERIRCLMEERGLPFDAAREACAAGNVFTTHTPVAAGNDWFPGDLVEESLGRYRQQLGLSRDDLLALGRVHPAQGDSDFCMTVLALRLSAHANGVSRLHGEVSRQMWSRMWPDAAPTEVPIAHVTNGVHAATWVSPHMADLYERHLGPAWRERPQEPDSWRGVRAIPDRELWDIRQHRRGVLLDHVRFHMRRQLRRQGTPAAKVERALDGLGPEALTIGFARRFATYKRATLILRDRERLMALLANPECPVQLLFAGKAHPHDHPGKELIRDLVSLSRQEPFLGRIFFLEDYDINLGRYLVQGCDLWLNTPRRPEEASGTSGMKAVLNGAMQISVLDGWWVEACDLHEGWTIGRGEVYADVAYQDEVESNALYDLLETEVIPLFYRRDGAGVPDPWLARVKDSIAALAPVFNTHRMVAEYAQRIYVPSHDRWSQLHGDPERPTRLSQWKGRVRSAWPGVRIEDVDVEAPALPRVGMRIPLTATVTLGCLTPDDVRVELYLGKVNSRHEIEQGQVLPLEYAHPDGDGRHVFRGAYPCTQPGSHGYTLRILPRHPDLHDPLEMGLIRWAS